MSVSTKSSKSSKPSKKGRHLVIVESPTKARTIAKFLPEDFVVEASIGHIRDLPTSASEIPAEAKGKPGARLGVDVENDFEPLYVVPREKKQQVARLKKLLRDAETLYLATDEDREGESISWHLVQVLKPRIPQKRLVFHEITREAIQHALENPRDLDDRLVKAQETRRILDRLYGYEVSPILWRKVAPRLSAGRVQSVTVRLIVERERERQRFVRSTYWDLTARFMGGGGPEFDAVLNSVGGKRVARGKDFDSLTGELRGRDEVVLLDEAAAVSLCKRLEHAAWKVERVERKPFTDRPAPPFTTSTLQQEANRKLRLTARATMQAAQRLYENGLITYMRTDSTTLSEQAVSAARGTVEQLYGKEYLPDNPRTYQTKVKNAQEAHEAIRPSGDFRRPEEVKRDVGDREAKVYELIWKRTVACQMADATGQRMSLRIGEGEAVFHASGKTIEFPGHLRAYVEGADDPAAELADKEVVLPSLSEGDPVDLRQLEPKSHTTQPPARYTEASLVRELEARGIGRPSTYATIIDTILHRRYVFKQGSALVPTFVAFSVVKLLENHFADLVDIEFTAKMEDDLDAISLGNQEALPYLRRFYFGEENGAAAAKSDHVGLKQLLEGDIDAREVCTLPLDVEQGINIRVGRNGPYLERGTDRASIPEGMAPDELDLETALDLLAKGSGPTELGTDPETGRPVHAKLGRYGPYVQLGENDDEPKMKSLLPGMEIDQITLEDALRLLRLPRKVGDDPETGEDVLTDFGRYGPYVRRGNDSRSLDRPEDIFEYTMEQALARLAEPPARGGRRRASQVLRELGPAPDGETVRLLKGPYGPYVSDGSINASVPKDQELDTVTLEQALALIAAREATGKVRRKKTAKKKKVAGKKKTARKSKAATKKAGKKTAKKSSAKKPPAKKDPGKKDAAKKDARKSA